MIELVVESRCTGCGDCVSACPTHVFDLSGNVAVIARQQDCQTCFMCELYCQADALYVGPDHDRIVPVDAAEILNSGLLGQYRRESGWHEWTNHPEYSSQFWRMAQIMNGGRAISAALKARQAEAI